MDSRRILGKLFLTGSLLLGIAGMACNGVPSPQPVPERTPPAATAVRPAPTKEIELTPTTPATETPPAVVPTPTLVPAPPPIQTEIPTHTPIPLLGNYYNQRLVKAGYSADIV